jgi:hypothetical protein
MCFNGLDVPSPNQPMQRTRDRIQRSGSSSGREPLIGIVPRVLCLDERSPLLFFRDRAASTLIAIEIEMVAGLRLAARGRMASLL